MTRRPCGLCRLETVRGRGSCFCLMTARGTSHPPREGSGRPGLPDTSQVNDQPRPCSLAPCLQWDVRTALMGLRTLSRGMEENRLQPSRSGHTGRSMGLGSES